MRNVNKLTPREKEVMTLFCKGKTFKEICEILLISRYTLKSHFLHIYEKYGLFQDSHISKYVLAAIKFVKEGE